jgi:hypothetical protein
VKIFNHITTLLLAVLIVVGIAGFKVEKFYCGSYLRSIHIISCPTPCCAKTNKPEGKCRTEKQYFKIEIDSEAPPTNFEIDIPNFYFGIISDIDPVDLPNRESYPSKYLNYKPPLLLKDIPVLIESFLI